MKVTLATILQEEEYAPLPGTQYEVAAGHVVALVSPTIEAQERFYETADRLSDDGQQITDEMNDLREELEELEGQQAGRRRTIRQRLKELMRTARDRRDDVELAQAATEGDWPENGILQRVCTRICEDFQQAARGI